MSDLYGEQYLSNEAEAFIDALEEHIDNERTKDQADYNDQMYQSDYIVNED